MEPPGPAQACNRIALPFKLDKNLHINNSLRTVLQCASQFNEAEYSYAVLMWF
jgi:hypothetical protein